MEVRAPQARAVAREPSRAGGRGVAGLAVTLAALAIGLHVFADLRYPPPWVDEAHFMAPASSLARTGSLASPFLHAPQGIFWMPDGWAVALAGPLLVLPDTIVVARAVSLVAVLVSAGCLWTAAGRLGADRLLALAAVGAWLASPRVVLMGNTARMEALLLALACGALLAAASRRWLGALALAALSVTVHPTGVAVFAAFAVAAVADRGSVTVRSRGELTLAAVTVGALFAEAAWLAAHAPQVAAHLSFQFTRKTARWQAPFRGELAAAAVVAVGALDALATRRRDPARAAGLLAVFLLAGALVAIRLAGREMWYGVLGYETAALLAVVGVLARTRWRPRLPGRSRTAVALLPALVAAALACTLPYHGLRMTEGAVGEYDAFASQAVDALHRFDAGLSGPAVLALDQTSALGPWLARERWANLRVVDPTPVTPLPPGAADFMALTPIPPDWSRDAVTARTPAGDPLLEVRSGQGTFALLVYPAPARIALP